MQTPVVPDNWYEPPTDYHCPRCHNCDGANQDCVSCSEPAAAHNNLGGIFPFCREYVAPPECDESMQHAVCYLHGEYREEAADDD